MAKGYSYLRRANVVIDPALNTIALSTGTYTIGIVARAIIGETPEVAFVLTVSRAGMQAGTIVLIGGLAFAVIGTFASAATFLLATTTKTAPPEEDELLVKQCRELLAPYKTLEGITRLQELSPDEFKALLPCIPLDHDLGRFLSDVGRQGETIENQIHAN
jgi:hypothetical protein